MALTRTKKEEILKGLKEKIIEQKSIVFIAIEKIKAEELFNLREKLKADNCLLKVSKKTLLTKAFEGEKIEIGFKELKGQVGLIFGFKEEIAPAKIAYNFKKENQDLKILGGFFGNQFVGAEEIITLAKLPSRIELLAKFIGSISSPMSGLANVLQGNIKGLLNVLAKAKA
jgi:large subunit ribosomal protein L10